MSTSPAQLEQWEQLLRATKAFREAKPWEWLPIPNVIGVEDPATGEMTYCSVMGGGGEEFGLLAFRGLAGYWAYSRITEGDPSYMESTVTMRNMDAVTFSLAARDEVDEPTRRVYRELGYSFRGKQDWPLFQSYIPGHAAWKPDMDELGVLTRALEQTLAFALFIRQNEALMSEWELAATHYESGAANPVLHVGRNNGSPAGEIDTPHGPRTIYWRDTVGESPVRVNSAYDNLALVRLRKNLPVNDTTWEFDVVATPMRIGPHGQRPATAEMALAIDAPSLFVLGFDMTVGDEPSRPPASLMEIVEQAGYIPAHIAVSRVDVWESLQPLAKALDIKLQRVFALPSLEDAFQELLSNALM